MLAWRSQSEAVREFILWSADVFTPATDPDARPLAANGANACRSAGPRSIEGASPAAGELLGAISAAETPLRCPRLEAWASDQKKDK